MREKYPFTGHFGNTHAVIPTPEWGGGGAGPNPLIPTCLTNFLKSRDVLAKSSSICPKISFIIVIPLGAISLK